MTADRPSSCPVCDSSQAIVAGTRDRHGRPLKTLLCLGCGLFRVDPLPTDEALRSYYRNQYRLEYKGLVRPNPHHVIRAARAARDRIAWMLPHLPAQGRWLDVGAGSGEFAFLLQRKGLRLTALEPNQGYGQYVREQLGLDVVHGFLEDLPIPTDASGEAVGDYVGLSCFHMLEHHPDPIAALRRMRRHLQPGGLLAVEVPNAAFELTHPESRFHPAHLVHFTVENLGLAAARAGLASLELRTSSDGGVVWGLFRNTAEAVATPQIPADSLAALLKAEKRRSAWRYFTNPTIWTKTVARLFKLAAERRLGRRYPSPVPYLTELQLP